MPPRCVGMLLLLGVVVCPAQDRQLATIVRRMADNLRQANHYTCLETIDRWSNEGGSESRDRIRLEVAVIDQRERFAWPGSSNFEDKKIADLIGSGTVTGGDFADMARVVFFSGAPRFERKGETVIEGAPVVRYDFSVPEERSKFLVRDSRGEGIAGYAGSFWASRDTLDVVRFDVSTTGLPANLLIRDFVIRTDYAQTRIGTSVYLLPSTVESRTTMRGGGVNRNLTRFTGCKQYTGESTVRFDEDEAPQAAAASSATAPSRIPAGVTLETELTEPLRLSDCAIGDAVRLIVTKPAPGVPKRSTAQARVVRMEVPVGGGRRRSILGLRLTEVGSGDRRALADGKIQAVSALFQRRPERVVVQEEQGASLLVLDADQNQLPKGFYLGWRTQ